MTDQPSREPAPGKPQKKPYGPGILMLLGFGLLVLAAFCFKDVVYPGDAAKEWQEEGATFTIYLNWTVMIAGGSAAVYLFALAAKRSKGGAGEPTPADKADPEEPDDEPRTPARRSPGEGG